MSGTLLSPPAAVKPPPISPTNAKPLTVVLVGNPNAGKTSLFNSLTGLRQKVANYPGVTVERKEGVWSLASTAAAGEQPNEHLHARLIDLPGLYSIDAASPDERIARDVILGDVAVVPAADVLLAVVDATNLRRNLYLVAQLLEFGRPVVVALTMIDTAEERDLALDYERLAEELGVPVVPIVAAQRRGLDRLAQVVACAASGDAQNCVRAKLKLSPLAERELAKLITENDTCGTQRFCALRDLYQEALPEDPARRRRIADARARLAVVSDDWWQEPVLARYSWIEDTLARATTASTAQTLAPTVQDQSQNAFARSERDTTARGENQSTEDNQVTLATAPAARQTSDESFALRLDRWTTHKIFGPVIFLLLMLVVFQTIFSWASLPMDLIDFGFSSLGATVRAMLAPGLLTDLIVDGVIAGVGGVLIFLPQIALLFFFVALLEDSGYMARAAFLMDRLMRGVGLHGKAFVPLLSSFACAIPGIMATRTIENRRDRLATIMVAPLMSCSARLPVYTLMIGAFFADSRIGFVSTGAIVLMTMYALGVAAAIVVAWVLKRTLLRAPAPPLVMEMPPYRMPQPKVVLYTVASRASVFIRRAGTVILALSILLWALTTFPRTKQSSTVDATAQTSEGRMTNERHDVAGEIGESGTDNLPVAEASEQLRHSFAGRMGRFIEPTIAPLGFDWQIGIGLIASFAAREVFVSTMSIVYSTAAADGDADTSSLVGAMRDARRADGSPVWTGLTAVSLMVFFVLACQCLSTVAIVRRETNSWRWALFMVAYMLVLAYGASLATYQGGRWLGFV